MLKHVLVKEVKPGALATPYNAELVNENNEVRFYNLVAPQGKISLPKTLRLN